MASAGGGGSQFAQTHVLFIHCAIFASTKFYDPFNTSRHDRSSVSRGLKVLATVLNMFKANSALVVNGENRLSLLRKDLRERPTALHWAWLIRKLELHWMRLISAAATFSGHVRKDRVCVPLNWSETVTCNGWRPYVRGGEDPNSIRRVWHLTVFGGGGHGRDWQHVCRPNPKRRGLN